MKCLVFFIIFSFGSLNAATDKIVLKNGMRLISTSKTWDGKAAIFGVFIRDAGALKFRGISGLPALSERYFSRQLRKLSIKKGFKFYSYLDWDYLAYIFIVPPTLYKDLPQDISRLFFTEISISKEELEALKKEVVLIGNQNNPFWLLQSSIIGYMVPATSVYNNGLYGDPQKIEAIDEHILKDFVKCYASPNNAVIAITNAGDIQVLSNTFSQFVPCFRQNDYSLFTDAAEFSLPLKVVKYLGQGNKKKFLLRIGIPSFSCNTRESVSMDILEELLRNDAELNRMGANFKIRNTCYKNTGSFELSLGFSDLDPRSAFDAVVKRCISVLENLDSRSLKNVIGSLADRINATIVDKQGFISVVGRYEMLSDDYKNIVAYPDKLSKVGMGDIKKLSALFNENKVLTYILWTE